MKVVQTNKAYHPKVGGIETTITTLSEGLVDNYNVFVQALVCNDKLSFRKIDKVRNGVRITYLPTYGFLASLPLSPGYFKSLSKLSADILHIHEPFPWADISLQLLPHLKKNYSGIVVSWHSDIIRQKWVLSFYRKYVYKFLETVDRIIVSNSNMIQNSEFLPFFKNKCEVIPIGVELSWVNSLQATNHITEAVDWNEKHLRILFVGRLVYYKGIEYLVDAMKLVPNASLLIIGSGPLEKELLKKIHRLGLDSKIKIIPEVDEKALHNYYQNCDFLVLPSIEKSETYGIVQIEAMACGKPVISTDLGTGTTFINQNGMTGIVILPRNSDLLAEAINKLVTSEELRTQLGAHARDRALKEFSAQRMVQRVYELYTNLLNG